MLQGALKCDIPFSWPRAAVCGLFGAQTAARAISLSSRSADVAGGVDGAVEVVGGVALGSVAAVEDAVAAGRQGVGREQNIEHAHDRPIGLADGGAVAA